MKKFLSILLVLIFCLGAFVGCDDETQTESSSEGEKTVTEFSEWENVYYAETNDIAYTANDLPTRQNMTEETKSGVYYRLIETYQEFLSVAQSDSITADFFTSNAILALREYSPNTISYDFKGLRDLSVENGVATVTYEKLFSSNRVLFADNLSTMFFAIPKSELGDAPINTVSIIEKSSSIKRPTKLGAWNEATENDSFVVVKSQAELSSFLTEHNLSSDVSLPYSSIGVIIYRGVSYDNVLLNAYTVSYDEENLSITRRLIFDGDDYQATSEGYFEMIILNQSSNSTADCKISITSGASYKQ